MKIYPWQERLLRSACVGASMLPDEIERVLEFVRSLPDSPARMIKVSDDEVYP